MPLFSNNEYRIKNIDVARCMLENALAYAKSGDMQTVIFNLEYVENLLKNPDKDNTDYTWLDFK